MGKKHKVNIKIKSVNTMALASFSLVLGVDNLDHQKAQEIAQFRSLESTRNSNFDHQKAQEIAQFRPPESRRNSAI